MSRLNNLYLFLNDEKGRTLPRAKLFFYENNSFDFKNTYADKALTSVNPNPVIADGAGRFPNIFLEADTYRVVLQDEDGVEISTKDDVDNLLSDGDNISNTTVTTSTGSQTVAGALDDRVVRVGSVAALRTTEPTFEGQVARLTEHTAGSKGLGNGTFRARFTFSESDDNGYFIVTAGGKLWERDPEGIALNPFWWGAQGNSTDGSDGNDDLAAFDAMTAHQKTYGGAIKIATNKGYRLSDTWKIPSEIEISSYGKNCRIYQRATDAPVIASENWFSAIGGSANGFVKISDLQVYGELLASRTNNHGIVIRDFYSELKDVRARNTGGDGIRLDVKNDAGTEVAGTLVENRLENCESYFAEGWNFNLGNSASAKMTDGYLINSVAFVDPNGIGALLCDNAAGWTFDGHHCYGNAKDKMCWIRNTFYTHIENFYIERFVNRAMEVNAQKATDISNIKVRSANTGVPAASGAYALYITRAGGLANVEVNVSNLSVEAESGTNPIFAIGALSGSTTINLSNLNLFGDNASAITPYDLSASATFIKYAGELAKSTNAISYFEPNGAQIGHSATSGLISGNAAESVSLDIGKINSFRKVIGTLSVIAKSNHDGGTVASYVAQVMVSAKDNSVDAWTISELSLSAAAGFTSPPVVTASNTLDIGSLDVAFQFSNAASQGVVTFDFTPSV